MKKYIYIPLSLESELISLQQQWLSMSKSAYTIVTGVYQDTLTSYLEGNSQVVNQHREPIARMTKDLEAGIKELTGYVLEISDEDLSFIPDALLQQCQVYDSSKDLLTIIKH